MSFCAERGKDRVVFLTKEDDEQTKAVQLTEKPEVPQKNQYFLPNGEINWDCPCHGHMIYGPCALEYREFLLGCVFPKGTVTKEHCNQKHMTFEKCVNKYPNVYPELQIDKRLEEEERKMASGSNVKSENSKKTL